MKSTQRAMLFCLGLSLTFLSAAFAEDAGIANPEEISIGKTADQFAKDPLEKKNSCFSGKIDALTKASKPKKSR